PAQAALQQPPRSPLRQSLPWPYPCRLPAGFLPTSSAGPRPPPQTALLRSCSWCCVERECDGCGEPASVLRPRSFLPRHPLSRCLAPPSPLQPPRSLPPRLLSQEARRLLPQRRLPLRAGRWPRCNEDHPSGLVDDDPRRANVRLSRTVRRSLKGAPHPH